MPDLDRIVSVDTDDQLPMPIRERIAGNIVTQTTPEGQAVADAVEPILLTQVGPAVAEIIAEDPTVAEAAAALAQSDAGLLRSDEASEDLVTFTDPEGRRSWLEIDVTTGGPSAHSADLLYETIRQKVSEQADLEGWGLIELDSEKYGYVFALVDSNGRWALAVDPDGGVHVPKLISDAALLPDSVSEIFLTPGVRARLWPAPQGAEFMASGDSQTAPGSGYGSYLSAELGGASVVVEAMGGHGVDEIAARQGGRPARTTSVVNIPAGLTSVSIPLDIDLFWQTDGTGIYSRSVVLQGVPGTLIRDRATKTYTFIRNVAGSEVWVSPGSPIFTATSLANREAIQLFLIGRNSIHATTEGSTPTSGAPWTPQKIADRLAQMIRYLRERESRFLVIELFPTRGDVIGSERRARVDEYNRLARELAPANFLPITYYLLNKALPDAGITPTEEDIMYKDQGVIGPSLSSDGVHLEPIINQMLVRYSIAPEIISRGWKVVS